MTGNLGKFSTEPEAEGRRDKDERSEQKREKKKKKKRGGKGGERGRERARRGDVRRLPDTARAGSERKTANGFPDSNLRRGVGWDGGEEEGEAKRRKYEGVLGGGGG